MADNSLDQLNQLLDKKFAAMSEQLDDRLGDLRQDNAKLNGRIDALAKRVDEGFANTATTAQIDTVAHHLQQFNDDLDARLDEQDKTLERIDRRLSADLNRLDDHGQRIEVLEGKTAHLPTRPTT